MKCNRMGEVLEAVIDAVGYAGIDPGFERNPGVGRAEQLQDKFRQSDRRLAEGLGVTPAPPRPAAPDQPEVQPVSSVLSLDLYEPPAVATRLERTLQAIDGVHSDGDLPLISVLPWSREGDAVSRVGEMIGIPPTGDTPELTLAHEVGHQLDWLLRDEHGTDMTDLKAVIADTTQFRAIRAWLQEAHDALQETPDDEAVKSFAATCAYLLRDREMVARAYAQYVAWRSGDAALLSQIDDDLGADSALVSLRQWLYAEFLPIALQFDMLFERVGWLTRT